MAYLVHNERIRLRATWLNTTSGTCLTVGVLAPLAAAFYGLSPVRPPLYWLMTGVAVWLGGAGVLHWMAARAIRRLRE